MKEIEDIYLSIRDEIVSRLAEFKRIGEEQNEVAIFAELAFCILTPQSRAKICWRALENLLSKGLLLRGDENRILEELNGVRFKYKKAKYIIEARKKFSTQGNITIKRIISHFDDIQDAREWLVKNVKGISYKEASHFLRNIGFGKNLAILDRHILKNLKSFEVITEIPSSLSKKKYLEIEKKMRKFAKEINIPMNHLDLLLWYKETGEIFK
ncbi:MAG: DNA lyase [Thermotoga sp.]|nr:MAG: DNA lyase [Thermotoga sp.]